MPTQTFLKMLRQSWKGGANFRQPTYPFQGKYTKRQSRNCVRMRKTRNFEPRLAPCNRSRDYTTLENYPPSALNSCLSFQRAYVSKHSLISDCPPSDIILCNFCSVTPHQLLDDRSSYLIRKDRRNRTVLLLQMLVLVSFVLLVSLKHQQMIRTVSLLPSVLQGLTNQADNNDQYTGKE